MYREEVVQGGVPGPGSTSSYTALATLPVLTRTRTPSTSAPATSLPGRSTLGSGLLYSLGEVLLEATRARFRDEERRFLTREEAGAKSGNQIQSDSARSTSHITRLRVDSSGESPIPELSFFSSRARSESP